MLIKDMFERDIDREINGVITADEDNEKAVEQELSEYVVTHELRNHFATFYDAYCHALDEPTNKIGVWLSGFFGSGKSHFLKMLMYLLSNRECAGKHAIDYIAPRFEDPMLESQARRAARIPTEAILFNIDSKGPSDKSKTAILQVFARVFYEHQGFCGDLKLARLERYIEKLGKTEAFREEFERITGTPWLTGRVDYKFKARATAQALSDSGVMSEEDAMSWIRSADTTEFSIDDLTDEIRDYAEARAAQNNGQFRLLFMVDEIGQYIGGDTNLMLNLQSIVEELGTKCRGRVWVMVTSQEAIDEVTTVAGNDFSKIQGRFATRLSLSGSCADEVIKRRILAKTPDASALLRERYGAWETQLKNLFALKDATADLIGYRGAEDFAQSFPFAGYQFKLLQKVMSELRKQGSSGKHLSSQERSMLSGFKEAAQKVKDRDENTIVPFWMFYDTLQTFLESYHRAVINRAAEAARVGDGLEPQDIDVLKLLFLLRWVDREVATTIDNICALMTSSIELDRMALREQVQASLDRLMSQNYVTRHGERYQFLTDEEQEVAQEIRRINPGNAKLVAKASDIVFNNIFPNTKFTLGKTNLPVDRLLDNAPFGNPQNGLVLNVIAGMDGSPAPSHEELALTSASMGAAMVVLCPEVGYQSCLLEAARIEQYANSVTRNSLPENKQHIVRAKQQEKNALEKRAAELLEQAIKRGQFYVNGAPVTPAQSGSAKKILEQCLDTLVQHTYPQLGYIDKNYESDVEVQQILNGTAQALPGQQPNARAIEEVKRALTLKSTMHLGMSMKDLQAKFRGKPYGWRDYDIAAVVAELVASKQAKIMYADKAVDPHDRTCVELLCKRTKVDKVTIELRRKASDTDRTFARRCVEELCQARDLPTDEDGLARRCIELLDEKRAKLTQLISGEYTRNPDYPGYGVVTDAKALLDQVLAVGTDPADLLAAITKRRDDFEDAAEDLPEVLEFFGPQREIFDRAAQLSKRVHDDPDCLVTEREALDALQTIDNVLAMPEPYDRIRELPEMLQTIEDTYERLLKAKRKDTLQQVEDMFADINAYAEQMGVSILTIGTAHASHKNTAHDARRLSDLDAIPTRLVNDQLRLYAEIEEAHAEKNKPKPSSTNVMVTIEHGNGAAAAAPTSAGGPAQSAANPAVGNATAPKPARSCTRSIRHSDFFPPKALTSAEDIDAYLQEARVKLLNELDNGPFRPF